MELLERAHLLEVLEDALAATVDGNGLVVLVSGEAGIGKTSLIRAFTAQSSMPVLWGTCDSLSTPRPLGPLLDVAAELGPDLVDRPRNQVFSTVLERLREEPRIVVFEDVHWADDATLDLLRFLGRRSEQTRALLILTYRDDELGPGHPLRGVLGDLATAAGVRRVRVPALSPSAVNTLVGEQEVDAAHLHAQTSGNPFFITEVLANDAGIPDSVRDAVLARVSRLSLAGRAVLDAAAVAGPRVEDWLLEKVTAADAGAVAESLANGILTSGEDKIMFRHELARRALLESMPPTVRLSMHRMVLDALRAAPQTRSDLARLTHHAVGAADGDAVLFYAPRAAREAVAVHSHREAAAHYGAAIGYAETLPVEEQASLHEAWAAECNVIDRRPDAIEARVRADEIWAQLGDRHRRSENLCALMGSYFGIGRTADAERISLEAISLVESLPPSRELAIAYRSQAHLRMFYRDNALAIDWGQRALELAERIEDLEVAAGAYNALGSAYMTTDVARAVDHLQQSLRISRDLNDEHLIANAYVNLGSGLGEVGQFRLADEALAQGIAYAGERDLDAALLYARAWRAITQLHLGEWESAAAAAQSVLRREAVSSTSRTMALIAVGRLRARRGDPDVWTALDEALERAEQTETLQRIAPARAARAEAAWLAGDVARAAAEAEAAYPMAIEKQHAWFIAELGFWLVRSGRDITVPAVTTPYAEHAGGDWKSAAAEWAALDCPYERASALAEGDDTARLEALGIFESLGAGPAADAVRADLRSRRVRGIPRGPRRATQQNEFGLTAREIDIVALLDAGLSNADIASRLVISQRTVDHHVSSVLTKLGADSRGRAAAIAREAGLITAANMGRTTDVS